MPPQPSFRFPKLATVKSAEDLRRRFAELGHPLPVDDTPCPETLGRSIPSGIGLPKPIGNRFAILPMEGWDATPDGRPTDVPPSWSGDAGGGSDPAAPS